MGRDPQTKASLLNRIPLEGARFEHLMGNIHYLQIDGPITIISLLLSSVLSCAQRGDSVDQGQSRSSTLGESEMGYSGGNPHPRLRWGGASRGEKRQAGAERGWTQVRV